MSEHETAAVPEGQAIVASAGNRRAHARLRAEDLRDLGARLASGAEIRLVDLSRSGAQFECDRRFLPNSTISLRLVTPDTTFVVSGRVVRSRIVRLDRGGLGYNVAVTFNELLQSLLEEPVSADPATTASFGEADPVEAIEAIAATEAFQAEGAPEADVAGTPDVAPEFSAEEIAAFEAAAEPGSPILTVTASVDQSSDALRDLFNGNNW